MSQELTLDLTALDFLKIAEDPAYIEYLEKEAKMGRLGRTLLYPALATGIIGTGTTPETRDYIQAKLQEAKTTERAIPVAERLVETQRRKADWDKLLSGPDAHKLDPQMKVPKPGVKVKVEKPAKKTTSVAKITKKTSPVAGVLREIVSGGERAVEKVTGIKGRAAQQLKELKSLATHGQAKKKLKKLTKPQEQRRQAQARSNRQEQMAAAALKAAPAAAAAPTGGTAATSAITDPSALKHIKDVGAGKPATDTAPSPATKTSITRTALAKKK